MNRHIKLKHPDQMSKNFEVSTYSDAEEEGTEEASEGTEEEEEEEEEDITEEDSEDKDSEGTEEEGTEEEEEEEDITEEDREAIEAGSNKYFTKRKKRKRRSDEDESEDESDVSSSDEEDRCDVRWGPKSAKAHKKCFKRIGQALNKYTINILKY